MKEKFEQIFCAFKANLDELGLEAKWVVNSGEPQIGEAILALLPMSDSAGSMLTEIALARLTDELLYVQIHSTLVTHASLNERLLEKITEINAKCPAGAFGVSVPGTDGTRHIYHRFNIIAAEENINEAALLLELFAAVTAVSLICGVYYKELSA